MAKASPLPKFTGRERAARVGPKIIAVRLADVRLHEGRVDRSLRMEPVHGLRVASRRLRAALDLFDADADADRAVKRLQDALGEVRDVQLHVLWLERQRRKGSGRSRAVLSTLRDRLLSQLPAREKHARAELDRWRTGSRTLMERSVLEQPPGGYRLGSRYFRDGLRHRLKVLEKRADRFQSSSDPASTHRFRIAAKKLRYAAELLAQVWPSIIGPLLDALAPLQDELGVIHDADVRVALIEQLAGTAKVAPSDRGGALAALVSDIRDERARFAEAARRRVGRWEKARLLQKFRRRLAAA